MRHRSGQRKLNITDGAHRTAMLRNISNSLIRYERIKTTLIRAKEMRRYVEPLITLGKKPSVANRRLAYARLQDRANVVKLFDDLGKRFASRPGGYVRVLKYGFRAGDNAPMALVELVERHRDEVAPTVTAKADKANKNHQPNADGHVASAADSDAANFTAAAADNIDTASAAAVNTSADDNADTTQKQ